ncbi:hypothetical protein YC2023_024245 [Brassica napus]
MDSNYLNMEMKHRSSTTMELEEERDGDWSRWAKRALESCGLWSSHGKGKPFMEMATEEGQTRGLKLGNEVVQGDTTKSEIEATLGKSKLVRVVEDRGVIRGLRQGKDECYQLVGRLREVWSELDVVKTHTSNPRCCQERRKQDVIFSFLMEEVCELVKYTCDVWEMNRKPEREEVCELVKYTCDVWEMNRKPERWKGGTSCKRGRLRKLSKEWLMKRRVWRKDSESEHLSGRMSVILKRIKDALQQMVIGECSYSAYMGETVGDSADMRGMDTKRADECVTKEEWDELVKHVYALATTRSLGAPAKASTSKPIIIDSGATHHMISDKRLISEVKAATGSVMIANGTRIPIEGVGNLKLFEKNSTAFYLPQFTSNLISVKKATVDLDCQVVFRPNEVEFQDLKTGRVIGRGDSKHQLYHLQTTEAPSPVESVCLSSTTDRCDNLTWHARLGHPHAKAIELILPSMAFNHLECEACILGKHCRTVFPTSETRYENCFDLVHSDVWTAPCMSRDSHKYFVTFIDEKSKYTWITMIPSKDRVLEAFMNFQAYVTNQYNATVKILRSDNGGEYTSNAFKSHLAKHGIVQQTSCPYTPQQNGVAERKNRHLMEVARSIMFHMNVPKRFWSDAVQTACYLINRVPTRVLKKLSPFEVLNKTKPHIDHLRVFGCLCYVMIPGERRNKLEAKSTKAMFIGYSITQKGYKCYDPITRRVMVSREVKFVESKGYYEEKKWEDLEDLSRAPSEKATTLRVLLERLGIGLSQDQTGGAGRTTPLDHERGNGTESGEQEQNQEDSGLHDQDTSQEVENNVQSSGEVDEHDQEETHEVEKEAQENVQAEEQVETLRRSTRIRRDPSNWVNTRVYYNAQAVEHPSQAVCSFAEFPEEHMVFMCNLDENEIPRSYEEAMKHKVWRDSVGDERDAMIRNDTWYESELPKGKKAVSSRWIFTIKYLANGEIDRRKTRLVARGFTQTYGEDYIDTFAPVAKLHTIRIVLSIATNLEWDLWQMDVKNAFLQGELEDEVYMHPPPGLEHLVKPGNVLRLKKAIYGLKQSPRAWYRKLSTTLNGRGFRKSELDHTLFTLTGPSGIIVILVYVDDLIITGSDKAGIQATKEFLKSVFDIKDLGEMKYFLGIEICRSKEGLFMSQRKYTMDMLKETDVLGGKIAKTPLEEGYKVLREGEVEEKQLFEDPKLYRKMVGKLIYLTITRPDICFAVNQVSQHMQAPKVHHWKMVDRILRYLSGTSGQGVWMGCNGSTEVVGYCDADWAGDRVDRRSTTGYCTFIGGNLVTWKSKKQKVISCSSAEAEYRAMLKLTNELVWIKGILKHLEIEQSTPMTMHCDNQAAIHIASNSVFHERTKHIEVDCHKVRQMIILGVILPCYTRSEDQLADVFTKAARLKTMESIISRLGLIDLTPRR